MNRLTREQAAIIGAFTGISCGPFGDIHEKIEKVMDRPVFTHEMASKELWEEVKKRIQQEFLDLCAIEEKSE